MAQIGFLKHRFSLNFEPQMRLVRYDILLHLKLVINDFGRCTDGTINSRYFNKSPGTRPHMDRALGQSLTGRTIAAAVTGSARGRRNCWDDS